MTSSSSSTSTSSKRAATESKRKRQCNGFRLTASGRRLPFVLEAHIVSFADAAELAALLDTSQELQALVHDWLRATPRLVLNTRQSFPGRLFAQLGDAAHQHLKRLQELSLGHWVFDPRSEWLAFAILANRATLRSVKAPGLYWTRHAVDALVDCAELRRFDCENSGAVGATQLQRLADRCTKLETLVLPSVLRSDVQLALLRAPLPALTSIDLFLLSLDEIAALAAHPKLTSLSLRVSSSMNPSHTMSALCDQLLPKLTKLQHLLLQGQPVTPEPFARALPLPALTKMHWQWPAAPLLTAPNCEELHVSQLDNAGFVQLAAQLPSLRALRGDFSARDSTHVRAFSAQQEQQLLRDASGRVRWPRLHEISLDRQGYVSAAAFCDAAANWPDLRVLSVALASPVTPQTVQALLAQLPKLENVRVCVDEKTSAPETSRACLKSPIASLRFLEQLSLAIADDELLTAFELPALKQLELRGPALRVEHLQCGLELMPSLQRISVNSATPLQMSAVCARPLRHVSNVWLGVPLQLQSFEFLIRSCPRVKHLNVECPAQLTAESLAQLSAWGAKRLANIHAPSTAPSIEAIEALVNSQPALRSLTFGKAPDRLTSNRLEQTLAGKVQWPPVTFRTVDHHRVTVFAQSSRVEYLSRRERERFQD